MNLHFALIRHLTIAALGTRFRATPRQRVRRTPGFPVCIALVLCAAIVVSSGCVPFRRPSCVLTHDQGCLVESEFRELAEEIADTHGERSSFRNQWGLATIRADRAYANLELKFGPDTVPGEGVTVGMLDTGIDAAHSQFRNKNIVERFLLGGTGDDGTEFSHGTAVASIIAGEEIPGYEFEAQGVAPGADLVTFSVPAGDPPELYVPLEVSRLPDAAEFVVETIDAAADWRFGDRSIDFLNVSLGYAGIVDNYSEEDLRAHFAPALASIAQEGSEEKLVLVWAAGNANGRACEVPNPECIDGAVEASSVGLLAGLAARIEELREHTVGVVSVGPDGGLISEFSNRCGIAADYCIAAPGEQVTVAYFGPDREGNPGFRGVGVGGGTSFAAPMVTGGLALMKQYFRSQLSGTDLLSRLLETANRSGPYADASIYGRGLMDLGAATSPVGEPEVALGARVEGPGSTLEATTLDLGTAIGDAFAQSLEGREIAAFDTYGAPFWYRLGDLTTAATGPSPSRRLHDFQRISVLASHSSSPGAFGVPVLEFASESDDAPPALSVATFGAFADERASHLALARHSLLAILPVAADLTAVALTTEGIAGQEPVTGGTVTWRAPGSWLGLRAGWMGERRTLLGSVPEGAFGDFETDAMFAGFEADAELGRWRMGASAEIGTVNAQARGGLFGRISPLSTSAFSLHASRRTSGGGALRVSLSQPLRVEDGHALLSVPSGRTTGGEVVRNAVGVALEPSGRQVDLTVHWQRPLELGVLRVGATLSREPGHRKDADSELVLLSGWRLSF